MHSQIQQSHPKHGNVSMTVMSPQQENCCRSGQEENSQTFNNYIIKLQKLPLEHFDEASHKKKHAHQQLSDHQKLDYHAKNLCD